MLSQAAEALFITRSGLSVLIRELEMVEAGHGTGIIPSTAHCQYRKVVMTRLIDPTLSLDYYQIWNRGRRLSPAADEFADFLQGYIARWGGPCRCALGPLSD